MQMPLADIRLAVGLMSGTSMDGIDAALVRTDGRSFVEPLAFVSQSYDDDFRARLRAALGAAAAPADLERDFTERCSDLVRLLLSEAGVSAGGVTVVGFHGHTLDHDPANGRTLQMGDGGALAERLSIDVVGDFRSADVAAGGQGAPFAPLYHAVLAPAARTVCFLNLGGVGNLTWIAADVNPAADDVFRCLLAFDTGPGCALIDDWMANRLGNSFDAGGALAASGTVDDRVLSILMDNPYFVAPAPKSLDRNAFDVSAASGLSDADGAATLTAFTAEACARAVPFLPAAPEQWLVTGGGRKNTTLMAMLAERLSGDILPVEAIGVDGDALEAQAFAYLAVRSLDGLPLSGPSTTGVPVPCAGGRLFAGG
jgi:anhydro-N-acetylmuramic acid kinase